MRLTSAVLCHSDTQQGTGESHQMVSLPAQNIVDDSLILAVEHGSGWAYICRHFGGSKPHDAIYVLDAATVLFNLATVFAVNDLLLGLEFPHLLPGGGAADNLPQEH